MRYRLAYPLGKLARPADRKVSEAAAPLVFRSAALARIVQRQSLESGAELRKPLPLLASFRGRFHDRRLTGQPLPLVGPRVALVSRYIPFVHLLPQKSRPGDCNFSIDLRLFA